MDNHKNDMHEVTYTTYKVSPLGITVGTAAGNAPTLTNSYGWASTGTYDFSTANSMSSGAIEQYRLIALHNLYQEVRLKRMDVEFLPYAQHVIGNASSIIGTTSIVGTIPWTVLQPWDMVVYHDPNDSAVGIGAPTTSADTDQAMINTWQMACVPGAQHFVTDKRFTYSFDLVAWAALSTDPNSTQEPTTTPAQESRPIQAPWYPTKVYTNGGWNINDQVKLSCLKYGFYNLNVRSALSSSLDHVWPGTSGGGPASMNYPIGTFRFAYHLEFRKKEFRPAYTGLALSLVNAAGEEQKIIPMQSHGQKRFLLPTNTENEEKGNNESPSKKPQPVI